MSSQIADFYKLSPAERRAALRARGVIDEQDLEQLEGSGLGEGAADCMIENVIGRFCLPLALATNFLINGKEYLIPMVVEEPSIVAGVSAAAKLARSGGGFASSIKESLLIGQIQLIDVADVEGAAEALARNAPRLIAASQAVHPRLIERGGGVREVTVRTFPRSSMVVVHLCIDTADAMGANLVNTCCEALAPLVQQISGGTPLLRILSNLTDRSLVTAKLAIPAEVLAARGFAGSEVRDRIVRASDLAVCDEYRAATHNKGIMNGIDAVAVATGNDWRAVEAGAHAYAALSGRYAPLATWRAGAQGELEGTLVMPLKVGVVGAQAESHPGVRLAQKILGAGCARELAAILGAVGLAQNLAALRALATVGISEGHLRLHARTVALAAETPPELFEEVVRQLVAEKEIKVWRAREIVRLLQNRNEPKAA